METGPNDPKNQYQCDKCGKTMLGYWRIGDLALCLKCREKQTKE